MTTHFKPIFNALTGHQAFPWQELLYEAFMRGEIPDQCDIPTGLGKTSVIPIWLVALLNGAPVPRRLVYVVNRRTIVDQSTDVVTTIVKCLKQAEADENSVLHPLVCTLRKQDCLNTEILLGVSTLRGEMADNEEWIANPAAPSVIIGTVDMIGSKLLFRGYGDSRRKRPLNAAFLGCDTLVIHDEAHLTPAFGQLLFAIRQEQQPCNKMPVLPGLAVMELSATHSGANESVFTLGSRDYESPVVSQRLHAAKKAHFEEVAKAGIKVREKVMEWTLRLEEKRRDSPARFLIFVKNPDDAATIAEGLRTILRRQAGERWKEDHPNETLTNSIKTAFKQVAEDRVALLTGRLRGYERDRLVEHPVLQILTGASQPSESVFLVATSAGEVGVDLDADCMVCDLTTLDSMIQRLGRLNRFGRFEQADIHIVFPEDVITEHKKRTAMLREARASFREEDLKKRATLEKGVASQEKKVQNARHKLSNQEEKVAAAKTAAAKGKATEKLVASRQNLTDTESELATRKAALAKHDGSRLQRFRKHRQSASMDFIQANAQPWALRRTLAILKRNHADLSPTTLREILATPSSREAFPPLPETYPLTPLLLDLWAQTSIPSNPACPEVESWLHGKRDELPETHICWRQEVNALGEMSERNVTKWFDIFPVQSTETLRYPSSLVKKRRDKDHHLQLFAPMLDRLEQGDEPCELPVVVLDRTGNAALGTFRELATGKLNTDLNYATIILPTAVGGLDKGTFSSKSRTATDVAADCPRRVQMRRVDETWSWRLAGLSEWHRLPPCGRLSQAVDKIGHAVENQNRCRCLFKVQTRFVDEFCEDTDATEEWLALFRPLTYRGTGHSEHSWPTIHEHEGAVSNVAATICRTLGLPDPITQAIVFAADHHDAGKATEIWQCAAGHAASPQPMAKGNIDWRKLKGYRHETDVLHSANKYADFAELAEPDLAIHLICAHHGWARPHIKAEGFPQIVPPEKRERLIVDMMTRYERLQSRFGWWNLAFLESIVRRADAIASSRENATMEEEE